MLCLIQHRQVSVAKQDMMRDLHRKKDEPTLMRDYFGKPQELTRLWWAVLTVAGLWGAGWSAGVVNPILDYARNLGRRRSWLRRGYIPYAVACLWGAG